MRIETLIAPQFYTIYYTIYYIIECRMENITPIARLILILLSIFFVIFFKKKKKSKGCTFAKKCIFGRDFFFFSCFQDELPLHHIPLREPWTHNNEPLHLDSVHRVVFLPWRGERGNVTNSALGFVWIYPWELSEEPPALVTPGFYASVSANPCSAAIAAIEFMPPVRADPLHSLGFRLLHFFFFFFFFFARKKKMKKKKKKKKKKIN
jgi:hypothetical protein